MGKIKAKESQNIEYKRHWQDEYLKWICGFANAQIESADGGVRVTFQRNNQGNSQSLQKSSTKSSTKSEEVVIAAIGDNPQTTLTDLAIVTGLSKSGVRKVIDRLRTKNLVQRVGSLKGGHWEIISKDDDE